VPISTLQFDRSAQTAIAITGIWAYSSGFEFFVTRLIRPDAPGFDDGPVPARPRDTLAERHSLRISLQLANGSKVISGRAPGDAEPTGPILQSRGGGGSSHRVAELMSGGGASACGPRLGIDDPHGADDVAFHGSAGGGVVAVAERADDELVIVVPGGHRRCQRPRDAGGVD
jgi:hypothetical protein